MQLTKSLVSLAAFVVVAAAITDRATFYAPQGEVGACGKVIQNSDLFVALSPDNYANGAHCGEVFVVERCCSRSWRHMRGCTGNQIDLTEGAFEILASLDEGEIEVTNKFATANTSRIATMLAALDTDRTRVADIEAQILDLERSLSALRDEKALVQERLDAYKYPVLTLPSEIISEIFIHFLPTYPLPPLIGIFSPSL
ncbi:hypothetical protein B0H13DRAFT_2521789 [Mycena leptocephala]|nr:hypothetical protein B0H13DRAFT_2521789 [Mycena leptocephala]